jgi:Tfp pilus assembly protein PilP
MQRREPSGLARVDGRPGQGRARARRSAAADQALRALRVQRVRSPDPFKPRKIEPTKGGSKLAPDLSRRREPLESYPLESLTMVGTLAKGKTTYALVRTPDKDVYQVTQGNYLGQNFGVVTGITDSEVRLKELVQDGSGDWTERTGALQLVQADTKTQERRK